MYLLRLSQPQLSAFLPYIPSYLHPFLLTGECRTIGCVTRDGLLCAAAVVEPPFPSEEDWRLSWFFVDGQARGQGAGSLLLAGAQKLAAEGGAKTLRIRFTLPFAQSDAFEDFLHRRGFYTIGMTAVTYRSTVGEVRRSAYLPRLERMAGNGLQILPLAALTDAQAGLIDEAMNTLNNPLSGLLLDEATLLDVSVAAFHGETLAGCLLMREEGGELELSDCITVRRDLGVMAAMASRALALALPGFPEEQPMRITAINPTSEGLVRHFISSISTAMEREKTMLCHFPKTAEILPQEASQYV
ncbi:N-acetyltransferase [Anaerotruncus colihominis]|uniref:N-acetyltransferase n=1 Tax=Anaerotruncus colihominis TaxID=169435 RepID=A0A845RFB1_9FIRM|nr:GNAT family N-acetyltransferase [Anaerotruncus colihominis]NBI78259.1 N-acetyltransferase [Anaerotruncus colihominis]